MIAPSVMAEHCLARAFYVSAQDFATRWLQRRAKTDVAL
jgi:hypothetical protein